MIKEFTYWCKNCGWDDEKDAPITILTADKSGKQELHCEVCNDIVEVSRFFTPVNVQFSTVSDWHTPAPKNLEKTSSEE